MDDPSFAQFVQLVKDMRAVQKRYVQSKSRSDLLQSKQLEAKVDLSILVFDLEPTKEDL